MGTIAKLPTYFISHGGGPWPWIRDSFRDSFTVLEASLKDMVVQLGRKPRAVLVISGHWEEQEFTVMSNSAPPMIYDYGGFPEYLYHIQYSAPGSPALARRVEELLGGAQIAARSDSNRGFDHGTYAPLAVMYPEADVPVVQLSLRADYDPDVHIKLGRALAPLREEGVLIVGSGLSYHNLRRFDKQAAQPSRDFDSWLQETLVKSSPDLRTRRLIDWENAPSARFAHPQEDHLLPLMVAVGAAESEPGRCVYHETEFMGGVTTSSFRFG